MPHGVPSETAVEVLLSNREEGGIRIGHAWLQGGLCSARECTRRAGRNVDSAEISAAVRGNAAAA